MSHSQTGIVSSGPPTGWLLGVFFFVLAAVLGAPVLAIAGPPAEGNEFCPVMPTEKSSTEFSTVFNNRRVFFCCQSCVSKFEKDPTSYVTRAFPPPANPRPQTWSEWALPALSVLFEEGNDTAPRIGGLFLAVTILSGLIVRRRVKRNPSSPGRIDRVILWMTRPTTLALWLALIGCSFLWERSSQAEKTLDETKSRITAAQVGGVQSTLLTWSWPIGLHELPRGVSPTYYRGNDERSPQLWNGGNYRTATFHLTLETPDGKAVGPGDKIGTAGLQFRFRFLRGKGTADTFFREDAMLKGTLIPVKAGSAKPVPFQSIRTGWEWGATARISDSNTEPPTVNGFGSLRGVWLVCTNDQPNSAHYYIQYVLHFKDGVLLPESRMWMVPVVLSGILGGPSSEGEWFSDRPIPEIDGENTSDPKLLGVPNPDGSHPLAPKK